MAGGKGKSSGGKSSGGKTSGVEGPKKQQSHSQRAGLQVCPVIIESCLSYALYARCCAWGTRRTHQGPLPAYPHQPPRASPCIPGQYGVFPPRSIEPRVAIVHQHLANVYEHRAPIATRVSVPSGTGWAEEPRTALELPGRATLLCRWTRWLICCIPVPLRSCQAFPQAEHTEQDARWRQGSCLCHRRTRVSHRRGA
jgi:hypothetical protein